MSEMIIKSKNNGDALIPSREELAMWAIISARESVLEFKKELDSNEY